MTAEGELPVTLRGLVTAGDTLGMDVDPLLAKLDLTRERLADAETRISVDKITTFWRVAARGCETGAFPIEAAEAFPVGAYQLLEFLASTSPTIAVAMQKIGRYYPLVTSVIDIDLRREAAHYQLVFETPVQVQRAAVVTFGMAILHRHAKRHFGPAWQLDAVTLALPRLPAADLHDRFFGVPVVFDAPQSALQVTDQVWNTPVPLADPTLFAVLDGHAKAQLADTGAGIVLDTRQALEAAVQGGDPRLETIAAAQGLSGRALQRALREAGTSFSDLQDQVRTAAAKRYLGDPDMALFDVSFLLGFSDQSGFNRAFKRWTGQTPRAWRLGERS